MLFFFIGINLFHFTENMRDNTSWQSIKNMNIGWRNNRSSKLMENYISLPIRTNSTLKFDISKRTSLHKLMMDPNSGVFLRMRNAIKHYFTVQLKDHMVQIQGSNPLDNFKKSHGLSFMHC